MATEEEKAAQRGDDMKEILDQTEDEEEDNKEIELAKEKQKKEEFEDPLNKILKRNANTATFSNDVRRETDPSCVIYLAILLEAAAIIIGIRGLVEIRRRKN